MGSWATSLHVRHENPSAVAAAIQACLGEQGFDIDQAPAVVVTAEDEAGPPVAVGQVPAPRRLTQIEDLAAGEDWDADELGDDLFEDDGEDGDDFAAEPMPDEPRHRRIRIYRPVNGWIGVLDSFPYSELGEALSRLLQTDALQVYVNDSDYWGYVVHRAGRQTDAFDSSGDPEAEADSEVSPELLDAIAREDEDAVERLMLERAQQGPIVFHDGRVAQPPALALLKARINEGKATLGDRLRYAWLWLKFRARVLFGRLFPSSLRFGFDVPPIKPLGPAELAGHVAKMRQLFPAADEQALRTLLPQSRFPSEGLLGEFLKIIGLPTLYAQLNYDYLEDLSDEELADGGIILAAHLQFRRKDE